MKRAHPIFYKDTIKSFRKAQQQTLGWRVTDSILQELKDSFLFDYENTPKEVRLEFEPKKDLVANNANGRKRGRSIPDAEQCTYCKNHRADKPTLAKSHLAKDCFFGDNPGFVKLANKPVGPYSSYNASLRKPHTFFLDTGCSNGSFTKDQPNINFMADNGSVQTTPLPP